MRSELDAYVGATAFEALARAYLKSKPLPFEPEQIGSHWGRTAQADVVAVSHASQDILIGECKWTREKVGVEAVRKLMDHTAPAVLGDLTDNGRDWMLQLAFFSRSGFTHGAQQALDRAGATAVDLAGLVEGLKPECA